MRIIKNKKIYFTPEISNNAVAIFLNGRMFDLNKLKRFKSFLNNFNYFAAADGGFRYIIDFNLLEKTVLVAGDFDSFKNPEKYISREKIIRFPEEKDYTDAIITLDYLIKNYNFSEYHFLISQGLREDHFLSLLFSLFYYHQDIYIYTSNEKFFFLRKGENIISGKKNQRFSIFPLNEVKNISINGAKYKFKSKNIFLTGQGVSNEFIDNELIISFSEGDILFSSEFII